MFSVVVALTNFASGTKIILYAVLLASFFLLLGLKSKKLPLAPFLLLGSFFYIIINGVKI